MKKLLSFLLAAAVLAASVTVNAAAPFAPVFFEDYTEPAAVSLYGDSDEDIAVLLDEPVSGKCGDNLTWVLDTEGTLTISGTGDMWNYTYNTQPWGSYRDNIKSAVIEDGVTSIGEAAFHGFSNLTSISIPDSVSSIGSRVFYDCSGLTSVSIPDSVSSISCC